MFQKLLKANKERIPLISEYTRETPLINFNNKEELEELTQTFRELMEWMRESDWEA